MNTELKQTYRYQVGGTLEKDDLTYVVRDADKQLYESLIAGGFCYVLNSRQMGKSSLRLRTMERLKRKGFACAAVDLSGIGTQVSDEQWYGGIVNRIMRGCGVSRGLWEPRWESKKNSSFLQRLQELFEKVLLESVSQNIVVFIDEIDGVIGLNFPTDDFFAFIRYCSNLRVDNSNYKRLSFCLLGVATPSDLIADKTRTPFNIGTAIELTGFTFAEAKDALTPGLAEKVENPEATLKQILDWTGGQPFLTQKLCNLVVNQANSDIPQLVQTDIINNWEGQDNPEHLRTIRDRILRKEQNASRLLGLYRRVLTSEVATDASSEQMELRLSGLVVKRDGCLQVYNNIYRGIFNENWIEAELNKFRPYSESINAWLKSGHKDASRLLREKALEEALEWGKEKNLSAEDYAFLSASQEISRQEEKQAKEILSKAKEKAQRTIRWGGMVFGVALLAALAVVVFGGRHAQEQLRLAKEGTKLEWVGNKILQKFESSELQALLSAMKTGQKLQAMVRDNRPLEEYPATSPLLALQQILAKIKERNQIPHDNTVTSVSFSPDGKTLATANADSIARLWDLEGNQIAEFKGHEGSVTSVSFSPDGKMLATASYDKTARLWDLEGNQIEEFKGHTFPVTSISFSPDGKILATASYDKTARLWDLSGNQIEEFKGHTEEVNSVSFSPDGKILATASSDKTVRLWDLSGEQKAEFKGHTGSVNSVSFSPDGKMLATASRDQTARLWDLSGEQKAEFKGHTFAVTNVSFSPDGKILATASNDGTTRLWDLQGNQKAEFKGHTGWVNSVSFSPDGKMLATGSDDKTARLWNLEGKQIEKLAKHEKTLWNVSFSPDSKMLATASSDGKVRLWNLKDSKIDEFVKHEDSVFNVGFSPDGKMLATASGDQTARLWNLEGKEIAKLEGHEDSVFSVSFSPDGKMLATASRDQTARLWNLEGKEIAKLEGHTDLVTSVSFSPDGTTLATGSRDQTARLWNLEGKEIAKLEGHTGWVYSVSFSPDGKMLATASSDGTARLWDLKGNLLAELEGHEGSVYSVSFSPDGKMLATASYDKTAWLWDLSGNQIAEFKHTDSVFSVSFSPDGKMLATGSNDNTARLWPVENLEELLARGCEWLQDYFVTHPEALAELEVCQGQD